jgi:hypothetical protein
MYLPHKTRENVGISGTIVWLMISGKRRAKKMALEISTKNQFFYIIGTHMCVYVCVCVYVYICIYVYIPRPRSPNPKARTPKPDCLFHCVRKCCHCARLWVAAPDQESVSADVASKNTEPFCIVIRCEVSFFFFVYWFARPVVFNCPVAKGLKLRVVVVLKPARIIVKKCGCPVIGQLQCDCFHCVFPLY